MSKFPVVKTINDYEVSFTGINNRERSTVRRLWSVALIDNMINVQNDILSEKQLKELSEEEKKQYRESMEESTAVGILKAMTHKYYEDVRDIIFKHVTIKGQGNALDKLNSFNNCFDEDETLEAQIFSNGINVYEGKQKKNIEEESTHQLTQL